MAEVLNAHEIPDANSQACVERVLPLIFPHLLLSTVLFWLLCWRADRNADDAAAAPPVAAFRVNPLKAVVPFVPLIILFLTAPSFHLLHIPDDWLTTAKDRPLLESRLIGAAMLVGVLAATLTTRRAFRTTVSSFFEGAGYGFTHIIGLIVSATCFGEGIKLIGLDRTVGQLIAAGPGLLVPFAALLPLAFGTVSGSGMAATQSLFASYIGPIQQTGADPFHIGAVVSIGAAVGRTISPVAAVTFMCAKMTDTEPFALAKRVALPALVGLVLIVILAMR